MAADQISVPLLDFTKRCRDAPQQARLVLMEVYDISGIFSNLQSFLLGTESASQSRTSLVQVSQVFVILPGCVSTLSELGELVDGLRSAHTDIFDGISG